MITVSFPHLPLYSSWNSVIQDFNNLIFFSLSLFVCEKPIINVGRLTCLSTCISKLLKCQKKMQHTRADCHITKAPNTRQVMLVWSKDNHFKSFLSHKQFPSIILLLTYPPTKQRKQKSPDGCSLNFPPSKLHNFLQLYSVFPPLL